MNTLHLESHNPPTMLANRMLGRMGRRGRTAGRRVERTGRTAGRMAGKRVERMGRRAGQRG